MKSNERLNKLKEITKPLMILSMILMPIFSASASTIVFDPFTDGGVTDGTDAQDVAWTASAGTLSIGNTGTNPGSGNYLQASLGSWAYMRGALPTDTALNLAIGETITLSFDFVYNANVGNRDNGFRFGIFDSTGLGTVVVADTGTAGTGVEIRYDTVANGDFGGGTGGVNEFTGTSDVVSYGTMSSGLTNNLVISPLLSITRTSATALSMSASVNGGTATVTDVDDAGDAADYLTNFSGGYIMIRNSGQPGDFRVDNVQLSVIPEPSSAMLLGTLGIFTLLRRRR